MSHKQCKLLRKKSKELDLPYKAVKKAFKRLVSEDKDKFIKKWNNRG